MEKKYKISFDVSFDECLSRIQGVCSGCGGPLEPIETEDNSGNPTFWSGCRHCCKFCYGVEKIIFNIAREMVEKEGFISYRHMNDPRHKKEFRSDQLEYYLDSQTAGACNIVLTVLRLQKKFGDEEIS